MSTSQIAPPKRGKTLPKSRFQRLWAEAEAMAQDNAELEEQLDTLVGRVDREVLAVEREMGLVIRQFAYRQIQFAQKKSLLKWQREVLSEWIDENLLHLSDMGLLDEPLRNEIARLRAFEMGIVLDDDSALSPVEQLDAIFDVDDDEDQDSFQADAGPRNTTGDLFGDDEEDDPDYEDELDELLRKLQGEFEGTQAEAEAPMQSPERRQGSDTGGVFKRLFRQTAAALHPDRESDETRRQEKHALMSQLLKARKEHDLVTIVSLHERHVEAASPLSSEDECELEDVLIDYLNQQRERQDEIIWQSPMHRMAYQQFYDKKPAAITRKIRKHIRTIEQQQQTLLEFMREVTTLKSFKNVLAARYDSRVMSDTWP